MSFLGVGWQEILLVLVVMLVFVGPERMPLVAYQIGRAVRTLQGYARAVRSEFGEEIGYIEEQYKTVRGEVDSTRQSLRDQQRQFEAEMKDATSAIQEVPGLVNSAVADSKVVNIADRQNGGSSAPAPLAEPAPAEPSQPSGPPLVF